MQTPDPMEPSPPTGELDVDLVEELFDRLLDASESDRRAALADVSIDPAVRQRVALLLGAIEAPEPRLEEPATPAAVPAAEEAPRSIGPYTISGLIGVGAMGVVYRAEQERPRREVALKLMRAVMDTESGVRRFEREAQLLGRLQHRGIAQVFESGTAQLDNGVAAYIAMELVDGRPLSEYADAARLDVRARVELLAELCDAVHHAHLRGVIHRDLKPTNVLVTSSGEVKVIDFGVARTVEAEQEALRATMEGQVIGTLAYMSPEQVRGAVNDLDARTDVYSLGVLAYELLAGRLPLDLSGMTLLTAAREIAERDVPRLGVVAPECRGDLEWVVGRALGKEREHRYQSADALAKDLRNWLAFKPVDARPPSTLYQLGRLARRNRAIAAGVAIASAGLVIATVISTRLAIANARLALSESEARTAERERADEATRALQLAQERAEVIARRTDPYRLDDAADQAGELWPILPQTIPAIDRWVRDFAEPLLASLDVHRRTLAAWRADAAPYSLEDQESDRTSHPARSEIAELQRQIDRFQAMIEGELGGAPAPTPELQADWKSQIARREAQIEELELECSVRRTYRFDDPDRQEAHDRLALLVGRLEAFADPEGGLVADVRARRVRALEIETRTVASDAAREAWAEAAAAIRSSPRYGGLDLTPQLGLLPLGENPASGLWEFWHVASGERPELATAGPSRWELRDSTGIVLVLVPGADYRIGAQAADASEPHFDPSATDGEGPPKRVALEPYFIGKYETTVDQWRAITGLEPAGLGHTFRWYGDPPRQEPYQVNRPWNPIEFVSWLDATSALRRVDLRLPSLTEWEAAARAGTETPWWTGAERASLASGETVAGNVADDLTRQRGGPGHFLYEAWNDEFVVHAPVGSFAPSPFGLHDTVGNVMELCADIGLPETAANVVAVRGGSYADGANEARVTQRSYVYSTDTSNKIGFRAARSVR